ncbi:cyclic pyranopterin phosphate synthase [Singulisphaera sp. GP187]|uniref:radical SAM protein n=1 Tax=Singulisphaera sp. GP187 TaxID=1882752 RepID=UPI0009288856|nr:radical SAM protein [Singulisphaera sp. GP187]SIO65820.1 cyclic pyranopterin phosphate synthase [Singulisphaera sp. GP187]
MTARFDEPISATTGLADWGECRFLSCSVLPVRVACNLTCPFCFSKSSLSALRDEPRRWDLGEVANYYRFARDRGAMRLVVTGGGEPLLRPGLVVDLVRTGRRVFDEVALFTNGSRLTPDLVRHLADAGLSYVCYSRHAADDDENRALMGAGAPAVTEVAAAAAAGPLKLRATCVMTRGYVDDKAAVWRYIDTLRPFGISEFTFKHTYVAYERSVFQGTNEDTWSRRHQVEFDPFEGEGEPVGGLPWGPVIRRKGELQICYYREPTPEWERRHQLCRSSNLLSNGSVYASLEDQSSLLYRLGNS